MTSHLKYPTDCILREKDVQTQFEQSVRQVTESNKETADFLSIMVSNRCKVLASIRL